MKFVYFINIYILPSKLGLFDLLEYDKKCDFEDQFEFPSIFLELNTFLPRKCLLIIKKLFILS